MRFNLYHVVWSVLAAFLLPANASAQGNYPTRPISIVLPYAAGSASDTLTRLVAEALRKELGQPVIVDARPGAGGSIGLEHVANAAPDGYTLVLSGTGSVAINPHIYKLRYNPLVDLSPISVLVEVPFVFVVSNDVPANDLGSFIQLAKKKPGSITSGNAGLGTQGHLTQAAFAKAAGIELNMIPYKGGAPATNDLLGGHLESMIDNAASQIPYITSGKVRALFVTSDYRMAAYDNVPTAKEAGLRDFSATGWFGLAAPKGTPAQVIEKLQRALKNGMTTPETKKRLADIGFVPVISSPTEAGKRAQDDYEFLGAVVSDLGLKPN